MGLIHRHEWTITGVDSTYTYCTQVLYGCLKCGKCRVEQLNGVWTFEQLAHIHSGGVVEP